MDLRSKIPFARNKSKLSPYVNRIERRKQKFNPTPFKKSFFSFSWKMYLFGQEIFLNNIIKEGDMVWMHVKTNFEWIKSPITSQTRIIYKMHSRISLRGDDTFHTCICVSIFTNVINFAEWVIREYKIRWINIRYHFGWREYFSSSLIIMRRYFDTKEFSYLSVECERRKNRTI